MAERSAETTVDGATETADSDGGPDVDLDIGAESTAAETPTEGGEAATSGRLYSARAQVVALATVAAGLVLGGLVPIVPLTGILGIAVGGFLHGLVASQRRYIESALAGAITAGLALTLQFLAPALLFQGVSGVRLAAIGAGAGLVLAVVGHYFGRDLRAGLTREL